MIIYPAIDLKDGLCVRLMQGDPQRQTVFGKDPVAVAQRWQRQGAQWLHVVDLDGAFSRSPRNREVILGIASTVSIPIQVGGGIRRLNDVSTYLEAGIQRVILGSVALKQPDILERACRRFPGRIALGIDARDGRVAVEGWRETSDMEVLELVERFAGLPLAAIIYTDIHRDGMQSGVNIEATARLLDSTSIPVIASGGVASLDDIEALCPLARRGLNGVITGRALYTGSLQLGDALECASRAEAVQAPESQGIHGGK